MEMSVAKYRVVFLPALLSYIFSEENSCGTHGARANRLFLIAPQKQKATPHHHFFILLSSSNKSRGGENFFSSRK